MDQGSIQVGKENIPESIIQLGIADDIIGVGRANSLWPLTFGIACCAIEMMATGGSRFDMSRFGAEVFRPSPRQADVLIIAGTITKKMQPGIKTLYDQMPEPKWVMALGNCAISGGPFAIEENYNIILGADTFLPVDVFIPGCPPRPEALLQGIIELEELVSGWKRFKDPETANSRLASHKDQAR